MSDVETCPDCGGPLDYNGECPGWYGFETWEEYEAYLVTEVEDDKAE